MISYKYNIYHSKKTKYLERMLRECCFVWNHALALQRRYYKLFGKYISVGKMKKHFAKRIRRNLLHSQTTQEILERLDESYNRFFKRKSNTSYYWALMRPCKNRIYDKSLKGYEGKPLCSECAAIEYSRGGEVVVVPGTWHGKFKKEWPTEEEKKHIGKNGILNY